MTSAVGSPVVLLTVTNADQSTYASAGVVLSENPLGPGNLHEQGVYALADCEPATPIQCNSIDPPPSNPFTSVISTEPGVNVTDPSPNVTYGGATEIRNSRSIQRTPSSWGRPWCKASPIRPPVDGTEVLAKASQIS